MIRVMENIDLAQCGMIYAKAFPMEHWGIDWTAEYATEYLRDFFEQKRFVGYTNLTDLYRSRMDQYDLSVSMPEFESSFNDDLTSFCREVGIEKVFTEKADFTRCLQNG